MSCPPETAVDVLQVYDCIFLWIMWEEAGEESLGRRPQVSLRLSYALVSLLPDLHRGSEVEGFTQRNRKERKEAGKASMQKEQTQSSGRGAGQGGAEVGKPLPLWPSVLIYLALFQAGISTIQCGRPQPTWMRQKGKFPRGDSVSPCLEDTEDLRLGGSCVLSVSFCSFSSVGTQKKVPWGLWRGGCFCPAGRQRGRRNELQVNW